MSSLPLFYHQDSFKAGQELQLSEDTSRHVVQVLRMQPGEELQLTNGLGDAATVIIEKIAKKACTVRVLQLHHQPVKKAGLHLAVGFTKIASRNEWLLEKATELGATRITPLAATRTQREHSKTERWQTILISAMLQSQQYYLPVLDEPMSVGEILRQTKAENNLIAHCMHGDKLPLATAIELNKSTLILIGPEGDFTQEEVSLAIANDCKEISLGNTRLRTETAAIAACAVFHLMNGFIAR